MKKSERRQGTGTQFRSIGSIVDEWTPSLPRGMAPAVLALIIGFAGSARADLVGSPHTPIFSAADLQIIARNQSLSRVASQSPWLVYRALHAMAAEPANDRMLRQRSNVEAGQDSAQDFDPQRDPDLDELQRIAPEAAHDLFLLIKKAGEGGKSK